MQSTIYNQKGEKSGTIELPSAVFNMKWNADLVHQVVTSMMTRARTPVAHTKNRGEVRGGGKKPWQQKGLGRARHGSIRSPIWVGGGVTHGPRNDKNFDRKINKKMKAKALYTILSQKYKDGEVLFVDNFSFEKPQARAAKTILDSFSSIKGFEDLSSKKINAAYINNATKNQILEKSFGNFRNVSVGEVRNMNPVDLLKYKYVVISNPEDSIKFLTDKLSK